MDDPSQNTNQNYELKGTSIKSSGSDSGLTELDSLIAETLSETKIGDAPKIENKKDEIIFKATPFIKQEPKPVEKKEPLPTAPIVHPVAEEVKGPEVKKEAAPAKAPQDQYENTFKTYQPGDVVKGKIVTIDPTGVIVDIAYKADGFVRADEVAGLNLKVGDEIKVLIEALSTREGNVALSIKKAKEEEKWNTLYDAFKNKTAVDANVSSAVGGGLVVDCMGIRAFVPASQVSKRPETQLAEFVGKTIPVKIIEIDRRRGKIIMSHKLGNVEKQKADKDKFFEEIEVGQILQGTVSSIRDFGAFVNVGGVEGLVHKNEMAWKRVDNPSRLLKVGQELDVFVLGIDKFGKKLSLGLKQLQPDPWVSVADKYRPGQNVTVKVLRFAKFGIFVELEEGIEGLVHISELSNKPFQKMEDVIKTGDEVKAKILRVVPEEQRIGLSIREIQIDEEKAQLREVQSTTQPQKITIGDTISEDIREQLNNNNNSNELPPAA